MKPEDTQQMYAHPTQEFKRVTAVKQTRRVLVLVLGGTLTVAGIILIPLPGPGLPVVFLGLTVLSWEFPWAKRLLLWAKQKVKELMASRKKNNSR